MFYRPVDDQDTIWSMKIIAVDNLTVENDLCGGVDATQLLSMESHQLHRIAPLATLR